MGGRPMKIFLAIILSAVLFRASADDEHILVNARLNAVPIQLAFDTGCGSPVVLYSPYAQKLGLKVAFPDTQPGPGRVVMGTTDPCILDLGITNFRTPLGVITIPDYLKTSVVGLLGWPALSNNIISLDAVNHRLSFLKYVPEPVKAWTKVSLDTNEQLALEIPGAGSNNIVAVDTGKDRGISLPPEQWRQWKAAHTNQPITLDAFYMPGAGLVVEEESFARQFTIGSLTLSNVPVMEANVVELSIDGHLAATFGLAALKQLDIVIDGPQGVAYLRPKNAPPAPYQHNRLGAVFVPRDLQSDTLLAHVAAGSPAFDAGVRDGDVLLKIGDLDVTQWRTNPNVLPLTRFFTQPAGTKLRLTLQRGDQTIITTAILRNILPPDTVKVHSDNPSTTNAHG